MTLRSFLATLSDKWSGRVASRRTPKAKPYRRPNLRLEALEKRELLAASVPRIIDFTPPNGSTVGTTTTNPPVTVTYSEAMNANDVTDPANYFLFNSEGQAISIQVVTADPVDPMGHETVHLAYPNGDIGYNNGLILPADTYSLYIRGDKVHDLSGAFTLANPGQIVVANTGTNFVGVLNTSADASISLLNSVQSYPVTVPQGSVAAAAIPVGIVTRDFDGDGFKDVAVASSGTNSVDIYAGTSSEVFDFTPTLRIALPAAARPVGLLSADFNSDGLADLAVLDNTGNVYVLMNKSVSGSISYLALAAKAVGTAPTSFASAALNSGDRTSGDLNGDGIIDIAVADPTLDGSGNYNVYILPGVGDGTFLNAVVINVGSSAASTTSVQRPNLIAVGYLGEDFPNTPPPGPTRADSFVVGGANGIQVFRNKGLATFEFTGHPLSDPNLQSAPVAPTALAIGYIEQQNGLNPTENVIAAYGAFAGTNGPPAITAHVPRLIIYNNIATNVVKNIDYSGAPTGAANETPTDIDVVDVNLDGKQDILVSAKNWPTSLGTLGAVVSVFANTSSGGQTTLANQVDYGVDNGVLGSGPVALDFDYQRGDNNTFIVTANTHFDAALNKTISSFTVLRGNKNSTTFIQAGAVTDPTGKGPTSVAVGDVNGDGLPDLVVADSKSSAVSLYLGLASGGYGPATTLSTLDAGLVGDGPVSVVLTDVNGDGSLDIVTADNISNTVSILLNDGTGNFLTPTTVAVGQSPNEVVVADFNHDSKIDLAVSHNGGGAVVNARGVTILLGNGNGTFQPGYEILSGIQASTLLSGDFFVDSTNSPDLVVADASSGQVLLVRNDGLGNFATVGAYTAGPSISALAAGDMNGDGFLDVVAVSGSTSTTQQISTLLSNAGSGFRPPVSTSMPLNAPVNSVAVMRLTPPTSAANPNPAPNPFLDLVVGTVGGIAQGVPVVDNVFTLTGNGDGTFQNPVPYEAAGEPSPAVVAVGSDPFVHVTTFYKGGKLVAPNLIQNGDFETVDLSNERGNLDGWATSSIANSRGAWYAQTGTQSPLSQTTVPAPTPSNLSHYSAMLDQSNLIPIPAGAVSNPNDPSTYSGSNFLYQNFIVPPQVYSSGGSLVLSLDLYINTKGTAFTNPGNNSSLDYRTSADYQVRVDVLDATALDANGVGPTQGGGVVIKTIFRTLPSTPSGKQTIAPTDLTALLASYSGRSVMLRISAVTNQGPLIVGVDNVSLIAKYTDMVSPSTSLPQLRNLGVTINNLPTSTDPTVIGQVTDDSGVQNVAYVAFNIPTAANVAADGNFNGPNTYKTSFFDAVGKFSLTLPNVPFGPVTVGVRVVDRAGNPTDSSFTFNYQGPSVTNWQAIGPGPINVTSVPGIQFQSVSGLVTAVATDPSDPSGNTYILGGANGGLWKTQDGGNNWTPLTDRLTDGNGNAITTPIGSLAYAQSNPLTIYAATGNGNTFSYAQPGDGILKSTNGGASFSVIGNSATVFAGARITKLVVDPTNPNIVYVAVAAGAQGPGLYRSTNGGATWANMLTASSMGLAAGTTVASVTDIVVNPADPTNLFIGLGNIGLAATSTTGGVWTSSNSGVTWQPVLGGNNGSVPNGTLPSGLNVGRVTLAIAGGVIGNVATYYVMVANPTSATPVVGGAVNYGTFAGLYKTKDAGQNFTKVMLKQGTAPEAFSAIDLLAVDAGNVGAMVVDPTDANVVYVGGSVQSYGGVANPLTHGLIRVDTGNMRDTTYQDPQDSFKIPNDGDDISKAGAAEFNGGTYVDGTAYTGEGVSWYDLAQNSLESNSAVNRLPASVTSLAVDHQGRLVIGTEEGIWRAVYHGVGYDFSSNGNGILRSKTAKASVQITTINGNLQLSELTSVAIDPLVPGRFYTTQYGTGSAVTSGNLSWNTSGLTGPNGVTGVNPGPDGSFVVAAPPDPSAPAGTLASTYLNFAFGGTGLFVPFQVEGSSQAGQFGTYVNLPTAGLSKNDLSGYLPVLNVFSQKVNNQDELLLGTDRIYSTRTSTASWSYIGPGGTPTALSAGAFITAATFAQSTDQVLFAATSDGKFFATFNRGADGWLNRTAGLPAGSKVTSITGDFSAASNTGTVYVTLSGPAGVGHVFRGAISGPTHTIAWTRISATLPDVNAYSIVLDPRSQPGSGAPSGRLYVGTQTGVYVTTDLTSSTPAWTRLGVGLPNVPVVSLQFNAALEELVAGTLGRGAFLISTDRIGARVVSYTPGTLVNPGAGALTSVTVTFNESISSFPLAQVSITGPGGPITPVSVTDVSVAAPGLPNPHTTWKITFAAQASDGVYTIKIGPDVLDVVGHSMDQNQNGTNGEATADVATLPVVLNSTDDGSFVSGLYNDVLGRSPDATGFLNSVAVIDAARNSLLPSYANSYVKLVGEPQIVRDLYSATDTASPLFPSVLGVGDLMDYAATGAELNYWQGLLGAGGISFEQIIVAITADPTHYFTQTRAGHNINGMDAAWVQQVYLDLLHRGMDPATELAPRVSQLVSAEVTARTQDASVNLLGRKDYRDLTIQAAYLQYMRRNASAFEVALWEGRLGAGGTQEQMIAAILGSGEYSAIKGGGAPASSDVWIQAAYSDLFPGYPISVGERQYWIGLLDSGTYSREQVANILDTTDLYRFGTQSNNYNGFVERAYYNPMSSTFPNNILNRAITAREVNDWRSLYANNPGFRTESFLGILLGSSEYYANHTTANTPLYSQDQQWADAVYTEVLGNPNAYDEANTDLPFLKAAETKARVVIATDIVSSPEYHNDITASVYSHFLHRAPSAYEFALWQPVVGQAATTAGGLNGDERLLAAVFTSQEYFHLQSDPNDAGLHTNYSWLTSLYTNLRVPINTVARDVNLGALDAAYAGTRLTAIQAFTNSQEYRTNLIKSQYLLFLGRAASAADVTSWLGLMQGGATQELLIEALVSSDEYFVRSPNIVGQITAPSNTTFVQAAYLQLFNRLPSSTELNVWVPKLDAGMLTRQQVATSLVTSNLYRFGDASNNYNGYIERAYFKYMGRPATEGDVNFWVGKYQANPNLRTEAIIETILDSQEYFSKTHKFP